ncbi:alanine--tRNA ligase, mitochondrial [Sitodiplosis mosellana]|uniref:alanine--tRNA ligase, mitochondrial n=1 Tax=Sitodiplosis mosellana TaxID=263140 RepID=UPI0024448CE5|nr:alanine--tRNA ligase, mitochondrial [Sitodiplosis mosellana]
MMFFLRISRYTQTYRRYSSKIHVNNDYRELSAASIRNTFLDYFVKDHRHRFIRSSPVTPFCDPTVPFVNAGMNQFKNVFLGKSAAPCQRAANSQKCIRISGKHNDLDIIGTDGYHHTFFEMLGNWSFGDYYKEKACRLAWDLLTKSYLIDPRRLYVTYFGGDERLGLQSDEECRDVWRSIGVPDDHILPFGSETNFWEMGLSGPCGLCTEIHIDHLPNSTAEKRAKLVNAGLPDLTELWNIVFIEYNRNLDGTLEPLHNKYVDTGMGFERLVAVLQGKISNYDTDLFTPIFNVIHKESKIAPYSGIYDEADPKYDLDYSYRVVADHARMCSVCIADGMYPQTNHRLRKIVRRTINICENVFKHEQLIENAIIPEIVNTLGQVYPELEKKCDNIRETFSFENEYYKSIRTKNRKEFQSLNISAGSNLSEEDTIDYAGFAIGFRDVDKLLSSSDLSIKKLPIDFLYDRLHVNLGLSEELIEKIAEEKNVSVDMEDFAQHKQRKRFEAKMSHQKVNNSFLDAISVNHAPKTDYSYMHDYSFDSNVKEFNVESIKSKIQVIQPIEDLYHIVLDKTNFYHAAGGQDGDIGKIIDTNGTVFQVNGVEIHKGYVIHSGHFTNSSSAIFQANQEVELHVDSTNRTGLSQHHTAMHLFQAAMKYVTGQIIFQQSSHVSSKELKCDLGSIGKRIDIEQLAQVERLVRNMIQAKIPIETQFLMAHDLYALDNVTTIPGEIYPDENIRVLKMSNHDNNFESIEPCCGTHARNTGELGDFCVTSFKFNGNTRSYDVSAVAGQFVAIAMKNEQNFLQKFEPFKAQVSKENSSDQWKLIETEAVELSKELIEHQMPYTTKAKALAEMEEIKKSIHLAQRALLRKSILSEMVDVLAKRDINNESFIIHVLNTQEGLEDALIADAERVCQDLPVIILNVSNNKIIHGRACIPIKYTTNKFNAKHWIEVMADSLKIKCKSSKKKKQFAICSFHEIPEKEFSQNELNTALVKAKARAQKAFDAVVSADRSERDLHEARLIARIDGVRKSLENETNVSCLVELEKQSKEIRDHMKNNLFLYTTRAKCMTELTDIDEKIYEARANIEKNVVSQALSDSSLQNQLYIVHAIKTEHTLGNKIMMHATDLRKEIPIVIINVSKDDVIGRVSIPLKYTNDDFRAKHLSDAFNDEFDGNCIHDGSRYDTSVCDFRLNTKLVNDEQLNSIFKRVGQMIKKFLDR